jgi:hypothetical protein
MEAVVCCEGDEWHHEGCCILPSSKEKRKTGWMRAELAGKVWLAVEDLRRGGMMRG